jgi:uncharacterized membrane protein YfcA
LESWAALALVGLGVVAGAFGTLVGAGGGFVLTPILLLVYPHDSPKTITAISLTAVFFNAASGSVAYARQHRIDYRSGLVFGAATLPGSIGGALAVEHVGRRVFDLVMGLVLASLAIWLAVGRARSERGTGPGSLRVLTDSSGKTYRYRVPIVRGAVLSLGVGFLSTFLGIGGGVVHVPLLVRALGFPTHIATATSHFVLMLMAGTATATHLVTGTLRFGHGLRRALALSLGVVVGAQVGARVSVRLSGRTIELLLVAALAALAVQILVEAA